MSELEALCRACGMCCDGSLFGRVTLALDEVEAARKHLRIVGDGRAFEQPCIALGEDRACSIYAERPSRCRAFTCRLYERHRAGGGPLEERLAAVRRTRELVARADALEGDELDELRRRIEEDFERA